MFGLHCGVLMDTTPPYIATIISPFVFFILFIYFFFFAFLENLLSEMKWSNDRPCPVAEW